MRQRTEFDNWKWSTKHGWCRRGEVEKASSFVAELLDQIEELRRNSPTLED